MPAKQKHMIGLLVFWILAVAVAVAVFAPLVADHV